MFLWYALFNYFIKILIDFDYEMGQLEVNDLNVSFVRFPFQSCIIFNFQYCDEISRKEKGFKNIYLM